MYKKIAGKCIPKILNPTQEGAKMRRAWFKQDSNCLNLLVSIDCKIVLQGPVEEFACKILASIFEIFLE